MVFCFFIIISNNFMEEKCVCSVQIWKEVFDHAGEDQEDAGYRSKTNGSVLKLGGCN